MPSECEKCLKAWPSGYSLGRMGLEELGGWASQNEPWVVGCLVPTAEEALRNQVDKLTHSGDASEFLSSAAPTQAQWAHGHRDMEAKMEILACSPPQGSSTTTLTSTAERSAEPCPEHTPRGTRLFPSKMGKPVSVPGTDIYLEERFVSPPPPPSIMLPPINGTANCLLFLLTQCCSWPRNSLHRQKKEAMEQHMKFTGLTLHPSPRSHRYSRIMERVEDLKKTQLWCRMEAIDMSG